MKNIADNSEAVYKGIIEAGFKLDDGQMPLSNDLGVSIDEFLTTIGFEKTIEKEGKRSWVTFRNNDVDFIICYRDPSENQTTFATLSMIKG